MRWRWLLPILVSTSVAHASPRSNPPFLGIGLEDYPTGVRIPQVTAGTGAERAGLQVNDVILAMDGSSLVDPAWARGAAQAGVKTPVETLMERILDHQIGDQVHLVVTRAGSRVELDATLGSRVDLVTHQVANKELHARVTDLGDQHSYNLDELTGHPTIVGWVYRERQGGRSCMGCARILDKISDRLHDKHDNVAHVLEVTNEDVADVKKDRDERGSSLDTAIVSDDVVKPTLGFVDTDRVYITVVDCHGIVRFVALIAPGADDEDAAIDEVVAAVAQCEHRARA